MTLSYVRFGGRVGGGGAAGSGWGLRIRWLRQSRTRLRAGVGPPPRPGQTRTLRFVSNVTQADSILLRWERYEPLEARDLLSFIVYYKES